MTRFALYNPSIDQYVSYLLYNRKTKTYDIEYTSIHGTFTQFDFGICVLV